MRWYLKLGFAVVYTVGYFFLTLLTTAFGESSGTAIFLAPVFTWILVFIAIFLSDRADTLLKRVFFVVSLSVHYAHILLFLRPLFSLDIDRGTELAWSRFPEMIIFAAAWYLLGQIAIWVVFLRSIRQPPSQLE